MARHFWLVSPPVLLALFFVVTDVRGVDFGHHWDEKQWQIDSVRNMVEDGVLLPRSYVYPCFTKFLVLLPTAPAALRASRHMSDGGRGIQKAMLDTIDSPDYLLRVRRLFITVSALAIVWVYGAAVALGRKPWEAFVAACGLGLSWEYAYHARWVATDCILTQFSALNLLALALFYRTQKPSWLYAAAVAAGLGAGTKYPGVLLLVPVLLAGALIGRPRTLGGCVLRFPALCGAGFAAYLVTTPATLLDPFRFIDELHFISANYAASDTHGGYTAATHWQHYKIVLLYFATTYFSPYKALALVLFACALVGSVVWLRREPRVGVVIACFPVVFVVFFVSNYHVAIVRNYLVIVPFLTILAARGVAEAFDWFSERWIRWGLTAVLTCVLGIHVVWLVRATESIRHVDPDAEVRDAVVYLGRHAPTRFQLSSRIRAAAVREKLTVPPNVTDRGDADAIVFVAPTEGPDLEHWKANDPWLTEQVFGPREVNFNWYPTWSGHERIVVMSAEKAKAEGIALAQ